MKQVVEKLKMGKTERKTCRSFYAEPDVKSKYNEMFQTIEFSNPNYHLYVYAENIDTSFYNLASSWYGTKYVCLKCRRQTRSKKCCSIDTIEKKYYMEVPKTTDNKGWDQFEQKLKKTEPYQNYSVYSDHIYERERYRRNRLKKLNK